MNRRRSLTYCITIMVSLLLLLAACSDDENNSSNANDNTNNNINQEEDNNSLSANGNENNSENTSQNDDQNANENEENNDPDEEDNAGEKRQDKMGEDEWEEDDTGLSIGDTGLSDSNIGKAEITLDSAEMVDNEELDIDDVENTDINQIISVHLTVKNIGENDFVPEDVLYSGELRAAGKEYGNEWGYFEGVSEEWQDNLEPDETTSGVIVFNHKDKDAYELSFGKGLSGLGNETQFEFNKDEMD